MKKALWKILFLVCMLVVAYYYNYHELFFKRPQSVHSWRQSDCASLALNYYQGGMNFFEPETHNLTSDQGTSGKACTSEIPILYYSVALVYKVFGYNEAIFRILNTLLFFIGLFYLYRFFYYLLKDGFWAIALSILFFTSPVLVFYGNNFLSNSSALAFSIVGWYYLLRYYFEQQSKWFIVAVLMFFLAATFKITALFSLFAMGGIYLVEVLGLSGFKKNTKLFEQPVYKFLVMFAAFSIIALWVVYARYYNQKHDCTYFSTTIFPVWMLDKEGVRMVLDNIRKVWLFEYYHPSVLLFLCIALAGQLLFYRSNLKLLNFALGFLVVQAIIYILLQFWTFKDHDYYTIDMYILAVLFLGSFFYVLKEKFIKIYTSPVSKVVFALFVVFNVNYAQKRNVERYEGWRNNNGVLGDAYFITDYLREIGVTQNDTIISIPDGSNLSLYLMNQKGWTEYTDARLQRQESISYNGDSTSIQESIDKGAKYLILSGIGQLYEKTYLQYFCKNMAGRYNNTLIFNLKDKYENFSPRNRTILRTYRCGANRKTDDGKAFIGEPDSTLFRNAETQSSDYAFENAFACKLSQAMPYGFTISMDNLVFGESFRVTAWRKISNKGSIIVSGKEYYNNSFEIIETKNGWEKLSKEFFITKELENKELTFYLYNNEAEPVYFDLFEISRFKSVID